MPEAKDQYLVLGQNVSDWDRLENLAEVRAYEGGAAYVADLNGRPCFAINGAALDWGDDDMTGWNYTPIYQFETVAARDKFVERWLRPWIRDDRQSAVIDQFRGGTLTREELSDALLAIENDLGD